MAKRLGRDWSTIVGRAALLVEDETGRVGVPPTLRRIHYLLLGDDGALAAGYTNDRGCYNGLSALTAKARDEGTFPPLSDRTRSVEWQGPTESNPAEILRAAAERHRNYRWASQPVGLLLVVEKDGLVPLMLQAFEGLGLPVTALRGHTSQTHIATLRWWVDILDEAHGKVVALYAGDYDPSGLDIERDLKRRLRRRDVDVRRVALIREQVVDHDLPVAPARLADSRTAAMALAEGVAVQVELDALDPLVLVQLFTDEIDQWGVPDTWWEQIAAEEAERQGILAAAERLG